MTFDEFCTKMYDLLPQCTMQEEKNGEVVIFTKKAIRRCESGVDEVVDFEPEVCHCADCNGLMNGDQVIDKPDKVIEVPEPDLTPVNDEVYRRLASLEADITGIQNRVIFYDNKVYDNVMTRVGKLECTISALLNGGDCAEWEIAAENASLEYYDRED